MPNNTHTTTKETRWVCYYRVSTPRQGQSGLGLDAQRESVGRFVRERGGTVVAEFTETESGKKALTRQFDLLRDGDQTECDGQVKAGAFLLHVGRRKIDGHTPTRPALAAILDRRRDAILALLHRGVGQADNDDHRIASANPPPTL